MMQINLAPEWAETLSRLVDRIDKQAQTAERQADALERIAVAQEWLVVYAAASVPDERRPGMLKALNDLDKRTGEQS